MYKIRQIVREEIQKVLTEEFNSSSVNRFPFNQLDRLDSTAESVFVYAVEDALKELRYFHNPYDYSSMLNEFEIEGIEDDGSIFVTMRKKNSSTYFLSVFNKPRQVAKNFKLNTSGGLENNDISALSELVFNALDEIS